MAKRSQKRQPAAADDPWQQMVASFRGHPALDADTVYALPEMLVESIKAEVPSFFSDEDVRFETELERLSGSGFFLRRPFTFGPLLPAVSNLDDLRTDELQRDAKEIFGEGSDFHAYCRAQLAWKQKLQKRQAGYIGWLITEPEFVRSRDAFCDHWCEEIQQIGFPGFPLSYLGERPPSVPVDKRQFHEHTMAFYRKWGLETFATRELAVPLNPVLITAPLYDLESIRGAGMMTFIPWYLLRHQDFDMNELFAQQRALDPIPQLQEWLNHSPKNWGHERFALILQLYVFVDLALSRRYSDRLTGSTALLDRAVARFRIGTDVSLSRIEAAVETVRKARQQLRKRIRATRT